MKGDMTAEGAAQQIAAAFHEAYERLAPQHGYETREASAKPWADVPENNRQLMAATVTDLLGRGVITAGLPTTEHREVVEDPTTRAALRAARVRIERLRTAVIAANQLTKMITDLGDTYAGVDQLGGTVEAASRWRGSFSVLADLPLQVEVEADDDEEYEPTEGAYNVREEEHATRVYLRTDGSLEHEIGTISAPEELPTLLHLAADEMTNPRG